MQNKSLVVCNHLGLGDILSISAGVKYLATQYVKIYLFTKVHYYKNTTDLYSDTANVFVIPIAGQNEHMEIQEINYWIQVLQPNIDIKTCGLYANYRNLLVNPPINFYKDFGLEFEHCEKYFSIPNYFWTLNKSNITGPYTFICSKSSQKSFLAQITPFLDSEHNIVIDPNINFYPKTHKYYDLAEKHVGLPFFEYCNIIKNAHKVVVIDSAFSILARFICDPKNTECVLLNFSHLNYTNDFFQNWTIHRQ